jgi:4-diphosphocytidyl-2-C-methyl-D-erythritol kinase
VPILTAPAKLTLSLRVVGRRVDGYHLIDAEMVTLDLADAVEIDEGGDGLDMIDESGLAIALAGEPEDNLVTRALRLVGRRAHVTVRKRIPPGAGLGGGSADAAAILRWAGHTDLATAAMLGADVPFCLTGGRARVEGIGEIVSPLPPEPGRFTLLTPPILCPTAAVYAAWDELGGPAGANGNDLEAAALLVAPALARWRDELAAGTGLTPRLAGSGSTWFVEGAHPGVGRTVVKTIPAVRSGSAASR